MKPHRHLSIYQEDWNTYDETNNYTAEEIKYIEN